MLGPDNQRTEPLEALVFKYLHCTPLALVTLEASWLKVPDGVLSSWVRTPTCCQLHAEQSKPDQTLYVDTRPDSK